MFKRLGSIMLTIMLSLSLFAVPVTAETVDVQFSYDTAKAVFIELENEYRGLSSYDRKVVGDLAKVYCSTDIGIDTLIGAMDSNANLLTSILNVSSHKDEIKFALNLLKSIPEADRKAAIDNFTARKAVSGLSLEQQTALDNIYADWVSEDIRNSLANDNAVNDNVILQLVTVLNGKIKLTDDYVGGEGFSLRDIDETFAQNLVANLSGFTMGGKAITDARVLISDILKTLNESAAFANIKADTKTVLSAVDLYEQLTVTLGDVNFDGKIIGDGLIDNSDTVIIVLIWKGNYDFSKMSLATRSQIEQAADVNKDGIIDNRDVCLVVLRWKGIISHF